MKRKISKRLIIQIISVLLFNANFRGFAEGRIYTGKLKTACLPGLNCYSCPGAMGSCPIGSLQAVVSGRKHGFSFYVIGILIFFGVVLGRLICAFLCLFGLVQDLLYKIPTPKLKVPVKIDKPLRYLKYAVLLILVIILPTFLSNRFGIGDPWFCKWLCPAGTLEGGLPLLAANENLRQAAGGLFVWKTAVLAVIVLASVFIYRPFCKYLCPLGAFYGLFGKVSIFRMKVDKEKCTLCGACEKRCGMGVDIRKEINSAECIRCGECIGACPEGAISRCVGIFDKKEGEKNNGRTSC